MTALELSPRASSSTSRRQAPPFSRKTSGCRAKISPAANESRRFPPLARPWPSSARTILLGADARKACTTSPSDRRSGGGGGSVRDRNGERGERWPRHYRKSSCRATPPGGAHTSHPDLGLAPASSDLVERIDHPASHQRTTSRQGCFHREARLRFTKVSRPTARSRRSLKILRRTPTITSSIPVPRS